MPNFEQLIRNQQSNPSERLKIVEPINNGVRSEALEKSYPGFWAFAGSLMGSIVGTVATLVAFEKGLLNMDLLIGLLFN